MYGFILALLSALLFSASTPASKALLASLEPFQLAGILYLGAALVVAPWAVLERRPGHRLRRDGSNALRLAGAVLSGGVLGPVFLLTALRLTFSGSISLLLNFELVATAILGRALFREHLGRIGWVGTAGSGRRASWPPEDSWPVRMDGPASPAPCSPLPHACAGPSTIT